MHGRRMQIEPPVGLAAVQKDRYGHDGDVSEGERDQQHLPPFELQEAAGQIMKDLIHIRYRYPRCVRTRKSLPRIAPPRRSEEHTSELQSRPHLVCRLLLEK